jgi:DNA repair/transcription protein MET18/MMS19
MFDGIFCYFPITFEPPKNDPYGITSTDLKVSLRKCISANDLLAKDAFPGLIEKLNSVSESVKTDSLVTINECVKDFSSKCIEENWQDIWDGIKYEVLHGSEEGITDHCIEILRNMGTSLAGSGALQSYLDSVKKECKEKLEDAQSKLALPTAALCVGVAQSSQAAFEFLASFACTIQFQKFNDSPFVATQRGILKILQKFIVASSEIVGYNGDNLLMPYKDQILNAFLKALMGPSQSEVSLRKLVVEGLLQLCQASRLLTDEEDGLVLQHLNKVVLHEDNEQLSSSSLSALAEIARHKEELIIMISFP